MSGATPAPAQERPLAAELEAGWRRTSALGIIAHGLRGLGQALLPIVAIIFGSRSMDRGPLVALLVGGAIIAVSFIAGALSWWRTQFRIGESDIRLHKGVLGRSARSVPFERIQDVSLEQGLFARLLGLVEVRFETGAGGKDELTLAFVSEDEGARLRETVRARLDPQGAPVHGAASGPPATATAEAAAAPLFTMGPRRLLLFGVFEFSLVLFAVLAGAAQQFDFLLPFDIWDIDDWDERLAGPGAWLAGLGWASRIVGVLIALLALAAIGLATGMVRTFAREYGFRLERTAKGFRRRRGLLTRTDVVMPVHRVQALVVSTGFLRRRWGWHKLAFISLAQDAGSAHHTVAPFAKMEEVAPIARAAEFELPDAGANWLRPDVHYRMDRTLVGAAGPGLAALVPLWFGEHLAALGLAVLAIVLAARQYLLALRERYALDQAQLLSRKGSLAPRMTVAAREKLQTVEIVQGPLARLHNYADLRLGLAGGRLAIGGVPIGEARRLRAALLASITKVDFSHLPR